MSGGRGVKKDIVDRLRDFIEAEARSCSMDFGCVTPEYIYRMWGGAISMEDIEKGDGVDILLFDRSVFFLFLTNDHTSGLGLEEDTTRGDGGCTAVLRRGVFQSFR
jgi:hypothetical protein